MLSQDLEVSLNLAVTEASRRGHPYVTVEHILFALLHNTKTKDVIESCGGSVDAIRGDLESFFREHIQGPALKEGQLPQPTIGFQRVIQRAAQQVQAAGKEKIQGANVLVSIFSERESFAVYYLKKQSINRLDVLQFISHGVAKPEGDNSVPLSRRAEERFLPGQDPQSNGEGEGDDEKSSVQKDPLKLYTTDLCEKARQGKIDPLIGRDVELERTMQILCRRRKNNPLFVGDAGVGKTAIAEGLALKIVNGEVPEVLKGTQIFALDMGSLVAGSKFRGDFEQRLKGVMNALKKIDKALLFIDELHTVIGAGAVGGGALDASNILKPALASGELRCMGSTTFKEYRAHIENDHALARRFQKIDIEEPSQADTVEILKGLKAKYEEFHNVHFSNGAIKAAVELSSRYMSDRKLPDKALDVLDEAAAAVVLKGGVEGDKKKTISVDMIQATVARMARIPAQKVSTTDREALKTLEKDLKAKVFGQDKAIEALTASIRLARSGMSEPDKPIGSFLFSGPTGVGKTEVAKQLAEIMGVELLRFDMSEYMERHSVSRLIGAPPGYVGFDQGGMLTDAITKNPHAVLLLDEIEKAHPDMQNILLQVMDHGTLTDNNGRKSDFRNVIIIMTTNAGAKELSQKAIGFERKKGREGEGEGISKAVRDMFSPEFRNRLNAIITFGPLPLDVVKMVAFKFIEELNSTLQDKKVVLLANDEAIAWIARNGYDEAYGARPIKRLIEEKVKKPLANELLFGRLVKGGTVEIRVKNDELEFVFA